MKSLFFLMLFSLGVSAQDFTRYQAENDHFQNYTREEMATRMGEASALLPYYACNGVNEQDPFWPAIRQNEAGDSLRIQLYKSDEQIVYKKGQYFKLNGEEATDLSNLFVAYVVDALSKIEAIPEGQKLLRQLERSHFPLKIAFGGNAFNPHNPEGQSYRGIYVANAIAIFDHGRMSDENLFFGDIGAGGVIGWNPKTEGILPHIALAHEMFHSFDSIRGILDMRFVEGPGYESAFVSEFRAVYFENITRKAAGVAYRTHYGQEQTGPGVLDANGEPIYISSPCLK